MNVNGFCYVSFYRFHLMTRCWSENPDDRPKFRSIVKDLSQQLEESAVMKHHNYAWIHTTKYECRDYDMFYIKYISVACRSIAANF